MHLTTPGVADLLTDSFVLLAQILIAQLYFTRWEKLLPRPSPALLAASFSLSGSRSASVF